jgi:hypothetical protein
VAPIEGGGVVTFVGLNPSTADSIRDDPTLRRCIRFAREWGFAQLQMVNLFAYRMTDPRQLRAVADPVGPENDDVLSSAFGNSDLIVAAWGVNATAQRVHEIMRWPNRPRHALGLTKHGAPRHPLYVRADAALIPFTWDV